VWFRPDQVGDFGETWLESVGRALLVAQLFEDLVKRTLFWYDVATELPSLGSLEARAFLEKAARATEEPFESRLARATDLLKARYKLSDEHAKLLREAKDARNFFAHDAALLGIEVARGGESVAKEHVRFRSELDVLIRAYNLLSAWAYEFEEREPAPGSFARRYPRTLEAWVLEPIRRPLAGN